MYTYYLPVMVFDGAQISVEENFRSFQNLLVIVCLRVIYDQKFFYSLQSYNFKY